MKQLTVHQYIRNSALKRIAYPFGLMALILILFFQLPIYRQLIAPRLIARTSSLTECVRNEDEYVIFNDTCDIYYSGYDYTDGDRLKGHYYYLLSDDKIIYFVLPAQTGRSAEESRSITNLRGKLIPSAGTNELLCKYLAASLEWDESNVASMTEGVIFSAVDYITLKEIFLYGILLLVFLLSAYAFLRYLLYIIHPVSAPVYRHLHKYGNPAEIVAKVDAELAEECLVLTRDMALLPDYLVEFSEDISVIVPLEHILWVYEHAAPSQTKKLKPMKFSLHIVMENGDIYSLNRKLKEDIDVILEELSMRYPNFFYGYSDEHYSLVKHILEQEQKDAGKH